MISPFLHNPATCFLRRRWDRHTTEENDCYCHLISLSTKRCSSHINHHTRLWHGFVTAALLIVELCLAIKKKQKNKSHSGAVLWWGYVSKCVRDRPSLQLFRATETRCCSPVLWEKQWRKTNKLKSSALTRPVLWPDANHNQVRDYHIFLKQKQKYGTHKCFLPLIISRCQRDKLIPKPLVMGPYCMLLLSLKYNGNRHKMKSRFQSYIVRFHTSQPVSQIQRLLRSRSDENISFVIWWTDPLALQTTVEWKTHRFSCFDFTSSRICSAVIHNYGLTNIVLCKPNETSAGMVSEISLIASWKWLPTMTDTVWGIIISVFHRIPARVCSLPTFCPPVISCTHCPRSNHLLLFMSQLAVSWPDVWLQSVAVGQGGATVHGIQKQRRGVSQGVEERRGGVGGVVGRWKKR